MPATNKPDIRALGGLKAPARAAPTGEEKAKVGGPSVQPKRLPLRPAAGSRQAIINRMPKEVSTDLKWFIWNEAWHVWNSCYANYYKERDPEGFEAKYAESQEDAARSNGHYEAVVACKILAEDFLDGVRAEVEDAVEQAFTSVLEDPDSFGVPELEELLALQPPKGVAAELYAQVIQEVYVAAATVREQCCNGSDLGNEMFREFEALWEQLAQAPAPAQPSRQAARQAAPTMIAEAAPVAAAARQPPGRQEPPLANFAGLQTGGRQAAQRQRPRDPDIDTSDDEAMNGGFAPALSADEPPATALCDAEGQPARVGCVGLWLDGDDFIVACKEGMMTPIDSAFDVGSHGALRNFPKVYSESAVLKGMLTKGGPCHAKQVKMTAPPDMNVKMQMSGASLQPLQSFENARRVKSKLGFDIVKGWAIYDLQSMDVGEGYLAERYWWNTTLPDDKKGWVDFTPRPEGMRELFLAESAQPPPRRKRRGLGAEQLALSEGLLCLRCPEFAVARKAELRTRGAVAVALRHALQQAERRGDGVERRIMASACIRGATLDQLSSDDENLPLMTELVSMLEVFMRVSQSDTLQEQELESLVEAGGIECFVSLMGAEDAWIAATAASALACTCHGNPDIQTRARNAGAPRALADLFDREDIKRMDCYAAEAVDAIWQAESKLQAQHFSAFTAQVKRDEFAQDFWKSHLDLCNGDLRLEHKEQPPRTRRGSSWGRTLAFAQVALGASGSVNVRRGTANHPYLIWVLGAEDSVEGSLAEEGFFDDANFVEMQPTEVILIGDNLREIRADRPPRQGEQAVVRTATYRELPWLAHFGVPQPDLAAVLVPEVCAPGSASKLACNIPELGLHAVSQVPIVISSRFAPSADGELDYRRKLAKTLVMKHVRCPFSTTAGDPDVPVDDNGWIFAVQGQDALAKALAIEAAPEVCLPFAGQQNRLINKTPVIFWGILDIKYDTARPVLDRVKVLETGDGQTSKFSNDGAQVKARYEAKYQLDKSVDLDMQHVISADKKLTHDIAEWAEYGHLVPRQGCFRSQYTPDLARQVQEELQLTDEDKVVLKLCNRTRAAGVVISPVSELDDVLEDLLNPPQKLDAWFEERLCRIMDKEEGDPVELGLGSNNSFEEQKRHWWSNESPVFVAEAWCKSVPVTRDGQQFDGTMRVAFALKRRQPDPGAATAPSAAADGAQLLTQAQAAAPMDVTPETLDLDWLGGYWKLPFTDMDSGKGSLRESVVSAAKASGTAPVNPSHLLDVFASLDHMVQHLYGRAEPSSSELATLYKQLPEHGAFLVARLGSFSYARRPGFTKQMLDEAEGMLTELPGSRSKSNVQAFIERARGILEVTQSSNACDDNFNTALTLLPTNANAMHLIGLRALNQGHAGEAVNPLTRSLLLDPDYKGVYVNLGLAYLRLHSWDRCITVSTAGQSRHPDEPRFHYNIAVSKAQQALALVNQCAEATQEMANARKAAETAEAEREKQEKAKQDLVSVVNGLQLQLDEASKARQDAKMDAERVERDSKNKPIEAGTKLRVSAKSAVAIFAGPEEKWAEIGNLRSGQVVTAAGPLFCSDGYRVVPIEPRGYVVKEELDQIAEKAPERELEERRTKEFKQASDNLIAAKIQLREASGRLKTTGSAQATIPRRPAKKLLDPALVRKYDLLRSEAQEAFQKVRDHQLSQSRRRGMQSPWLEVDDLMVDAMESGEGPVYMDLPPTIGWQSHQYRV